MQWPRRKTLQTWGAIAIATVTVIGGLFAMHYAIVADIRADYEFKLDATHRELEDARSDRDRYFEYLQSMPGSVPMFENIIQQERARSEELEKRLREGGSNTQPSYSVSEEIRKNDSFIDQRTGLIFGLISIERSSLGGFKGNILLTLPGEGEQRLNDITVGKSWEFEYANRDYQLVIREVNWFGDYVRIDIKELKK